MPQLNLKPTHKVIRNYYATLQQYGKHNITHEGAVSNPFAFLLDACAKQVDATLVSQYTMRTPAGNRIVIDGVILDAYGLPFAYWEAKVDKRGGIVNDPNRADQPRYIVDLIARVISVSLRTAEIVEDLSPFFLDN